MNSRERLRAHIAGEPADRTGFWLGMPDQATWPQLHEHFGTNDEETLRLQLNDDLRWFCPQWTCYKHPTRKRCFDVGPKLCHGQNGPLADAEEVEALDAYEWPCADDMDFSENLARLEAAGDHYRASGMWTCFYHDLMNLFGMEEYMMKMFSEPEVVEAATDRVCQFYYDANERYFQLVGDKVDAFFMGNDFGTQIDLICGPDQFDRFLLPWMKQFTDQAKRHGKQVILHSCGSIHRVIGRLIDIGVDCIHPLQALAANMDAATLARDFGGRVCFMGGIDTQQLLVHGSPADIEAEVERVKGLLGPRLIVSPSHEALLPNVPAANVEAMARAAVGALEKI